jgi:peptide deformylase
MGIAAPQVGIARAAAIVIPPDPGAEPVVMLNPVVISESAEADEQYEGCLSFFDVRGLVPRRSGLTTRRRYLAVMLIIGFCWMIRAGSEAP